MPGSAQHWEHAVRVEPEAAHARVVENQQLRRRVRKHRLQPLAQVRGAVFDGALEHAFHHANLIVRLPRFDRPRRGLCEGPRRQRNSENHRSENCYCQCLHDVPDYFSEFGGR